MDSTNSAHFASANQETQTLIRGRISKLSCRTYELKLLSFLTWIFKNRNFFGEYTTPILLERMQEMDVKDKAQRTASGKLSLARTSLR